MSPTAAPGVYDLDYASTNGQKGRLRVSVAANATVLYVADVSLVAGQSADAVVSARDGSGNPIAADLCLRPQGFSSCEVTGTTDSGNGQATLAFSPTVSGTWVVTASDSSAFADLQVSIQSNLTALSHSAVELVDSVLTVRYEGLAVGTPLQWSETFQMARLGLQVRSLLVKMEWPNSVFPVHHPLLTSPASKFASPVQRTARSSHESSNLPEKTCSVDV